MTDHSRNDVIDRLDAMRAQGETMKCSNYFRNDAAGDGLDESCRGAMATWLRQVQTALDFSPESVWIGMSYFDRYLSSGKGNSKEVLKSKCEFQLAAITAYYTAVKIHEPLVLGLDTLTQICRGKYTESDITAMESDMLEALDWRVSCHTPMDFARHLLELLLEELPPYVANVLLEDCQKNVDNAISDIYFSSFAPWVLGTSCLATSLSNINIISLSKKQACWSRLFELYGFDLSSTEITASWERLQSFASPHGPELVRKLGQISQSNVTSPSSPVCVTTTARLA